jgi:hypothetical protein
MCARLPRFVLCEQMRFGCCFFSDLGRCGSTSQARQGAGEGLVDVCVFYFSLGVRTRILETIDASSPIDYAPPQRCCLRVRFSFSRPAGQAMGL